MNMDRNPLQIEKEKLVLSNSTIKTLNIECKTKQLQ